MGLSCSRPCSESVVLWWIPISELNYLRKLFWDILKLKCQDIPAATLIKVGIKSLQYVQLWVPKKAALIAVDLHLWRSSCYWIKMLSLQNRRISGAQSETLERNRLAHFSANPPVLQAKMLGAWPAVTNENKDTDSANQVQPILWFCIFRPCHRLQGETVSFD